MMKTQNYPLSHRLLACMLLFLISLQSCANLSNPLIPVEEAQSSRTGGLAMQTGGIEQGTKKEGPSQAQDDFFLSEKDFKKGQILDSGAAGRVYKCKLTNNRGVYALKEVLLPSTTVEEQDSQLAEYRQELDLLKQLNHQNIVHLVGYHIPVEKNYLMLVMDLYDVSLYGYLRNRATKYSWYKDKEILLAPSAVKQIAGDVLSGLSYLHGKKIAHRDIKSKNVLVTLSGLATIESVHLTDFGISRVVENTIPNLTIGGTLGYMAPEVLAYLLSKKKKGSYDPFKADMYAFGALLYECATGNEPEESMTMPKDENQEYGILVNMVERCMQIAPSHRPDCQELLATIGIKDKQVEESGNKKSQESITRPNQGNGAEEFELGNKYKNGEDVPKDAPRAFEHYQKAAEQGHVEAQYQLGWMYNNGDGVIIDDKKSVEWYQKAASQGHQLAKAHLARMYYDGWGIKKNREEASRLINQVSTYVQENALANEEGCQFMLGWMYCNGEGVAKDFKQAVEWFKKAAEQGYVRAQCSLGLMYDNGEGVAKDAKQAVAWYKKAAEQGHAPAQYNLGVKYANGDGVENDSKQAVAWYQKAAEQGLADAQCGLGWMYASGNGVDKDSKQAVAWYQKAAEQGCALAQCNLGLIYANGDGVAKDAKQAVAWYQKAAEQGLAQAQYNLGWMYANGDGVDKDAKQAVSWYQKAAEQGNAPAQYNLGVRYANGHGVAKDFKQAVAWYQKAAEQGNASAQYNLGWMYESGSGVDKDSKQAVAWYQKAAEQGNAQAQTNLGVSYANGEGVEKILNRQWYGIKKRLPKAMQMHNVIWAGCMQMAMEWIKIRNKQWHGIKKPLSKDMHRHNIIWV